MKRNGFASLILLIGMIGVVGIGYFGYRSYQNSQNNYSPVISPIPIYFVDEPLDTPYETGILPTIDPITEADSKRKVDLLAIRNALEQYMVEHTGEYPAKLSQLLNVYLIIIPTDPVTKKEYRYERSSNTYTITATLSDGSQYAVTSPNINFESVNNGDEKRKQDIRTIQTALELYASDTSDISYPDSLSQLTSEHIPALPKDPVSGLDYQYKRTSLHTYTISAMLNDGTVYTQTNP